MIPLLLADGHGHGQIDPVMADTDHGQGHDADIWVTTEEASRLADVSARTVRRWIAKGEIQAEEGPRGNLVSRVRCPPSRRSRTCPATSGI